MRKIIASVNMSLDGVIDHQEQWHFQYFGDDAGTFAMNQLFASDALLMGRRTYDGFAEAWPNMEEQTGDFGVRMNSLPHYVVSDSIEKAEWGTSTIIRRADLVSEITKLKQQDGQDILMYGYGPVAHTLIQAGLLDEIRVWLHPILAGHGDKQDIFYRDGSIVALDHFDTQRLSTGINIMFFRPAAPEA
ncbi:dihydrofolate reductase family protein [Actinokineospora guangxiensis]|uniref:Dihydrofolate reductase family protein n=1 Tax=Actinokineospora guangxiensis TaxID=1490288 RepID=A0ABW0EEH8_9PSEU